MTWDWVLDAWEKDGHEWDLDRHVLVATYAGSKVHGTYIPPDDPNSVDDVDVLLVAQPPREYVYGLHSWEHWTPTAGVHGDLDPTAYSVQKFAGLLMKGNPNILGTLWAPSLIGSAQIWSSWVYRRQAFVSQRVYRSFVGYAFDQLRRLSHPNHKGRLGAERKEMFERFGYSPKNASHCLRLLRMGVELAETGEMYVDRTDIDAEELKQIKTGQWTLGQIEREAEKAMSRFNEAVDRHPLPSAPDQTVIEPLVMATVECLWNNYVTDI